MCLFVAEKASIDECFFDLTLPIRDLLLQRYPYLSQVPPDAAFGLDTPLPKPSGVDISWSGLGNLIPILDSEPLARVSLAEGSAAGHAVTQDPVQIEEAEVGLPENVQTESAEAPHEMTWADVVSSPQLIVHTFDFVLRVPRACPSVQRSS
jgi:hypothetical protein